MLKFSIKLIFISPEQPTENKSGLNQVTCKINIMVSRFLILLINCLFFLPFNGFAQVISREEAGKIAGNICSSLQKGQVTLMITGDSVISDDNYKPLLYLFRMSNGGCMIIAGDKRVYPVPGWTDPGQTTEASVPLPPALIEMIEGWKDQVKYCRDNKLKSTPAITDLWDMLEKGEDPGFAAAKDVLPLLATKWSQGCGYNALCPADASGPCGHALTGCVATAMAQVVRYNEHPVSGTGSKCYTSSRYGELCADFSDGIYEYSAMTNASGNAAVAKLMYHCGVSVSMNYGPSASSASSGSVANALRTWFDYTNGLIVSKSAYPEVNWENLLKRELDNNRPVYYSGYGTSGHAFVIDGFRETNHFHVNWGWGGSYDGYFYLSSLNPGSMSFTNGQQAIVGMIPTAEFTGPDFNSATDLGCRTPVVGDLSAGTDIVNYYRNTYPAALGKEMIYTFTTTLPGRIRIKISGQTGPVYTFLLSYSSRDSVVSYGLNGLVIDDMEPGTYFVAVESQDFSEPQFTIEAICPSVEADLDISSASVKPQYVQSLQENVLLNATVRNIGNSASVPCTMEYYISSDNKFDFGVDSLLGDEEIPALDPGGSCVITRVVTMPDSLLPGSRYILFIADRENLVPEADDENHYSVFVTVPDTGKLDCVSSYALLDKQWHYGNTLSDGLNRIEIYSQAYEMTGPEVVHDFISPYNGMMNISFVDKSPGILYAMILAICNENTVERSLRVYNLTDTLVSEDFYIIAGVRYFIIVDGSNGASGEYGLMVDLPGQCPEPEVEYWGSIDHCEGDPWPEFWTAWGYSNYQWFKDGISIPDADRQSYSPSSPGLYHVKIGDNGCTGASSPVLVRSDTRPDTASISTTDTTLFCQGGSAILHLDNAVTFPYNWAKDDQLITGATGESFNALESGSYSIYTINGACRVRSENIIDITVLDPVADIGEPLPLPSDRLRFYCTFDEAEGYEGGISHKYMMVGWDYEPADDRFGTFWKARYLQGVDQKLYWSDYDTIPDDYTLTLWFKTGTVSGGVIAGFYDNTWDPSKIQSVLYMSNDGKLHFLSSNEVKSFEISTEESYNDNIWHYVMIQHRGKMVLEVDDKAEMIESADSCLKESFCGYWTFGGPALPLDVVDAPSSVYFNGTLDDILCLDEANGYITSWMIHQPELEISLADAAPECAPATIALRIPYSQRGVQYRVWDRTRSLWAPVSGIGDGGMIQFGEAEVVLGSNEFQVTAIDLSTGCESVLDTVFYINVPSVCTMISGNQEDVNLIVYPVPSVDILNFECSTLVKEVRIIDLNGRIVHQSNPGSNKFMVDAAVLPQSVYIYRIYTGDGQILTGRIIILL